MPVDAGISSVEVIVLAAGAGTRLGLGPKAHVTLGDVTFLSRIVQACREAGLGEVDVVGSRLDPRIARACRDLATRLLVNTEPGRGMSSSVCLGLTAVHARGVRCPVLVFPVDLPLVQPPTLRALARAAIAHPAAWVRPVFRGEGGHPIALGADLVPEVLRAGSATPLRETLRSIGFVGLDVPTEDPGVVQDVDDAESLERALRQLPSLGSRGERPATVG
jgi:CTP:molybdopterin cytidylyltransferase MocA